VRKSGEEVVLQKSTDIPFNRNFVKNVFFWTMNFSDLQLNPGEEVEYWFEVWDNDGINGAKSARSNRKIFKAPTLDEIYKQQDDKNTNLKTDLKETIKDAKQLQKDLDDLTMRMLEKKELSWQDKKKAQELIDKQQQLQQQIENIKNENQLNNQQKEELRQSDENILEKQKQLENLFEQILSEEMKEKLKQLEELMKNLDKEKLRDAVEKMKQDAINNWQIDATMVDYFVQTGTANNTMYKTNDERINILLKDGTVKDISMVDNPLIHQTISAPIKKFYICSLPFKV
jgi:hypothetical protein